MGRLQFRFGMKALLRNPLRAIISLLCAVAAFGLAGMCIFVETYDVLQAEYEIVFQNNDDPYLEIVASNQYIMFGNQGGLTKELFEKTENKILQFGDGYFIRCPTAASGGTFDFGVYKLIRYFGTGYETSFTCEYEGETLFAPYAAQYNDLTWTVYSQISSDLYGRTGVYSGEEAIEEFGYELYGRLPETIDEVAIPQWMYNSFLCYGYRNPETGEETKITCKEDILGKTITLAMDGAAYTDCTLSAAIVGIIDADYTDLLEKGWDSYSGRYPPYLEIAVSRAFMESQTKFSKSGNGGWEVYVRNITVLRHSEHKREYFELVTEWKKGKSFSRIQKTYTWNQPFLSYNMTGTASSVYGVLPFVFDEAAFYYSFTPYLAVFAVVLMVFLSASTVYGKRKGLGTLQTLGASRGRVFWSAALPMLLFALVSAVGALVVELYFLSSLNAKLLAKYSLFAGYTQGAYLFKLTWQTWLFTFGVPLAAAILSTVGVCLLFFRSSITDNLTKRKLFSGLFLKKKKRISG